MSAVASQVDTTTPVLAKRLLSTGDIQQALRSRALSLQVVFDGRARKNVDKHGKGCSLDAVAGMAEGYAAKLLAPVPIKSVGKTSLGPMLCALGVELWMVENPDLVARFTSRIETGPHPNGNAGSRMLAKKSRTARRNSPFLKDPEMARIARARQLLTQSAPERRRIARKAALVRWRGKSDRATAGGGAPVAPALGA